VRGATRIQVNLLLALSGALTGALVGFAVGLIPMPDVPVWIAIPAALLDVLRVPVLAVRRQVPQYWGRIFSPQLTAVLYGARLGVGPLTILPTWLWWAAMAVGVSRGPWAGAAAGMSFALARAITMWVVGTRARTLDRLDGVVRVAFAAIALFALAACGGDDDDDASTTTTTDSDSIELEPSTTTTTTPEDTALNDLLLDDVLDGFTPVRDDVLDLDAAAVAEADPDAERALLETRGFVRGAARTWSGPDDDVVFVTAYEFASPDQADLYLVDGAETLEARGAERFDVPNVPGGYGFSTTEEDFVAHAVAFTEGPRWFLVLVGSSAGARTVDEVQALAQAQSALTE
jgi:hypothetical protein